MEPTIHFVSLKYSYFRDFTALLRWLKDIYEVLEFTVYDEDPNRSEFLGKLAIPLLNVRNGETRWYALKDQKLQSLLPNKGRVLLTMSLEFNYV